jgi:heptose-I-phosphate ethanolaminephosphotransferase
MYSGSPTGPPLGAPAHGVWTDPALIAAALLIPIVLGYEGRRVAQLMVLALPALAWLAWPVRSASAHRLRGVLTWSWAMAFALDGLLRAYLLDAYQAAPDSTLVLGAAANTNWRESGEYLSMHWRSIAIGSALLLAAGWLLGRSVRRGARRHAHASWSRVLLWLLIIASVLAYASKSWRRLHPLVFWPAWAQSVQALRADWNDQQRQRDAVLSRARAASPLPLRDGPATVMLVITDSINRDNMAIYGYGRATTPRLLDQKARLGDRMLTLGNAWSIDASTLPALGNIFSFGRPGASDAQHLLALARAAGYRTWWISNHDDLAIEQTHARLADEVQMVNRTPGRASASLDGEILDNVQEALGKPDALKLIVVHLMGAHPHYRLRFPDGENPFDGQIDTIESGLKEDGRPAWVRRSRHEYDSALLYHDFVVSELLQMTLDAPLGAGGTGESQGPGHRAWMYLSDHGQEVGHESDRAGHSPATASGYRIPALIWRDPPADFDQAGLAERPFRADWTGWVMSDLLGLQWAGDQPQRNVLDAEYAWQPPRLPVAVPSFTR